jgi:hypothetical protein
MNRKKLHQQHFQEAQNRARSVTVGTAFGGITELTMRRSDGVFTFAIMQPVETIELIHQLAANVGCHLQLVPRKDFGSWRDWKYTEAELAHYRGEQFLPGVGWPPHPNDMAPHSQIGANMPPPEQQPGLNFTGSSNGEAVAVEKSSDDGAADGAADAS